MITEGRFHCEALIVAIDRYAFAESRNCRAPSCPAISLANDAPRLPLLPRERFFDAERCAAGVKRLLRTIGHEKTHDAAQSEISDLLGVKIEGCATLDPENMTDVLAFSPLAPDHCNAAIEPDEWVDICMNQDLGNSSHIDVVRGCGNNLYRFARNAGQRV